METKEETISSLKEVVRHLQNKNKYVQSVSTVFRQKIALIMREMARNPSGFKDYEKMYTTALGELISSDGNLGGGPDGALSPRMVAASPQAARAESSKEDIKKAHHLCMILEEKNDLKQKNIDLRKNLESIKKKFSDLSERHNRLVELQATGHGASAAQQELLEKREGELQKRLIEAESEIVRLQTAKNQTVMYEDGAISDNNLQKQNTFLKAKVAKLKEELSAATEKGATGAVELQNNIDILGSKIDRTKADVVSRDESIRKLLVDKAQLSKEILQQRSTQELLEAKVSSLEGEVAKWQQKAAVGGNSDGGSVGKAIEGMKKRISELEAETEELKEEIRSKVAIARQKDLEISALGSQLQSFHARIEAFEAEEHQREVQNGFLSDVQQRLNSALDEIQHSQSTTILANQMKDINGKLQQLESVELQLRQKEDQLAVTEEELGQAQRSTTELKQSLESISQLFMSFPRSVGKLDRLIIELEEYKNEVQRCVTERDIPDLVKLEGLIDLRCLEAETHRDKQIPRRVGDISAEKEVLDDDSDSEDAKLMTLPPPPPLLRLDGLGVHTPSADRNSTPQKDSVSESDIRLTFQLFDEKNVGVLPSDLIKLCLTTLGLSTKLLPSNTTSMTIHEFMALCLRP